MGYVGIPIATTNVAAPMKTSLAYPSENRKTKKK
jgi:hypothetical protein